MQHITFNTHYSKQYQILCSKDNDILKTGLSEGLALRYDCNNGTCGSCIAEVIEGETKKIKHYDYLIKKELSDKKEILMCCHAPVSDVVLKVQLQNESKKNDWQSITSVVNKIDFITPNVAILTLKMPRSKVLQYVAGQEAILVFGQNQSKYPIASCPCVRNEIEFHIRHNPKDSFSKDLFNQQIKIKNKIEILGPVGIFKLKEKNQLPSLFIAWDVSFAPIKSIIEQHHTIESSKEINMVWAYPEIDKTPYFDKYARSWEALFDCYQYIKIPCDLPNKLGDYDNISNNILQQLPADISRYMVYISVPSFMVVSLSEGLIDQGCSIDNLYAFPT